MGLDLIVEECSNYKINNKNQQTYTVTEIFNFRNCWDMLEEIGEFEYANNGGRTPVPAKALLEYHKNTTDKRTKELLEEFFRQENISAGDDRVFDIYTSW